MKKYCFIFAMLLCGVDAFAASSLVRKPDAAKQPVFFARAGSLKASPVSKNSGNTSIIQDIVSADKARMSKLIRSKNWESADVNSNTIVGPDGLDADDVVLVVKDKKLWWGYDTGGFLDTNVLKELLDFTELYEEKKKTTTVVPSFNCINGEFAYRINRDDEWEPIAGSSCDLGEGDSGVVGAPGKSPSLRCNKDMNQFEITTDDPNEASAVWTLVPDSRCVADDGQDSAGGLAWRCNKEENRLEYAFYDAYVAAAVASCKEQKNCEQVNNSMVWIPVNGSTCVGIDSDNSVAPDIKCIDKLLYINGDFKGTRCDTIDGKNFSSSDDSGWSCVDGKIVSDIVGFDMGNSHTSGVPCTAVENLSCKDGYLHWIDKTKTDINTYINCDTQYLAFCSWWKEKNTVFIGGIDTNIACDNFVLDCNDLGLVTINGEVLFYEGTTLQCAAGRLLTGVDVGCRDKRVVWQECEKKKTEGGGALISQAKQQKSVYGLDVKAADGSFYNGDVKINSGYFEQACTFYETGIQCRDWYVYCDKSAGKPGKYDCVSSKTRKTYGGMMGLTYNECLAQCSPDKQDKVGMPSWYIDFSINSGDAQQDSTSGNVVMSGEPPIVNDNPVVKYDQSVAIH